MTDNATTIQKLILEIIASDNIDEKRSKGNQVVELFKESKLVEYTPVAIRLNTALELKEVIDNFIVHDNPASRDALKNIYTFVSQLLCTDESVKVA